MSKTLDCVGKCIGFLGVEGEAEASNSKALLEQGQQHRAQGKARGEITAEVNSPGPNWGHFNPFSWINRVWEQVALVSPAITREEG